MTLSQENRTIGGDFDLIDHNGQRVSRESFFGKFVVVFFGFTHCRVVCPRALARISSALDQLGELADDVVPLYISVDPERDTPQVLKQFLAASYPRFVGLTGERSKIDAMKSNFRVFAKKADDANAPDGYTVPHTALTYMLNTEGQYVAHFADSVNASALAERMRSVMTN